VSASAEQTVIIGRALSDRPTTTTRTGRREAIRGPSGGETHMSDDNSHGDILNQAAQGQLKSIIERLERLDQERDEISGQFKEVLAEAKGNGFDVKVLRKVLRIRKQDRAKRLEEEAITDLYLSALGEL
jgi:uncharacterized protein (UPF0335 family)